MTTDPYRLSREALPRHYRLVLEPDIANATFRGTVAIEIDIAEPTDRLVLNALDLEIQTASVSLETTPTDGQRPSFDAHVELDAETERLSLTVDQVLPKGGAVVELAFTGILNDKLKGFYRSTWTDEDGADHTIATTQFQSTDARRAFPCWDEPDFKATFGVTLVVEAEHLAVANSAEIERDVRDDGKVAVHFADTIPMSTYLVAFVVGPLEVTDPIDVDGVAVRIVHRPGRGHLTPFALDVADKALRYFTDYYALPYPGDKLDMLAIPDFAFGAMENLGCVTYREVLLLVDPDEATQPELQRVADVINHELAHMWFGDLVTMRWWNGIWLNEAFATFMETRATDAYRPDWDRWTDFGLSRSAAFDVDALEATRPIEFDVRSPADAEAMFDILTYEKGAAVVRMLEQFMGPDAFRDGIRHYLTTHQLGNTETHDLWDALETTTDQPVRRIMESWIFQGGYPVVTYERDGDQLRIDQHRFMFEGDDERRWLVPIGLRTDSAERTSTLLDGPATVAGATAVPTLNANASGFYRVRHTDEVLDRIADGAAAGFPAVERYSLVDDAWAMVLAGETSAGSFLRLAEGFVDDTEAAVWQRLAGSLGTLSRVLDDDLRPAFEQRVRELVGPAAERAGWDAAEGESDRDHQLRATLLSAYGITGAHQGTRDRARATHTRGGAHPSTMAAAVGIVAATGTVEEADDFWERYRSATTPQIERRYLDTLADFPDETAVQRLIERTLTDDIRSQDGPYILGRALTNRLHGPMVWKYVKDNWSTVNQRFPTNSISRLLGGVRGLSDPEVAADVQSFIAANPVDQGGKTIEQHLERLRINVALRSRASDELGPVL